MSLPPTLARKLIQCTEELIADFEEKLADLSAAPTSDSAFALAALLDDAIDAIEGLLETLDDCCPDDVDSQADTQEP